MFEAIVALIALALMEIVLGIDNIVFISVATSKLPPEQQSSGRKVGLLLALVTRILLLCGIFWIAQLTSPVFKLSDVVPGMERLQTYFEIEDDEHAEGHSLFGLGESEASPGEAPAIDERAWREFDEVSWRDIILLAGGIFLIYSSVREIHFEVESEEDEEGLDSARKQAKFSKVIIQVAVMDIIFSLDSVITAVGMAKQLWVMIAAIILAVAVMILFADQVGDFVDQNPTIKMLALAFLLLIGVMLVAEGIGTPISKGYIYFAMAFSLLVEFFNMRVRKRRGLNPLGEAT